MTTEIPTPATLPTPPAATPEPEALAPEPGEIDYKAEADKWKGLARKHEQQWKAAKPAVDKLAELEAAGMSDMDKAVKEAEERGRTQAVKTYGEQIAAAKLEAALTGVVPDPSGLVAELNLSKYVTDTGDVDTDAIAAAREKFSTQIPTPAAPPAPNLHQGRQGQTPSRDFDAEIKAAQDRRDTSAVIALRRAKHASENQKA